MAAVGVIILHRQRPGTPMRTLAERRFRRRWRRILRALDAIRQKFGWEPE